MRLEHTRIEPSQSVGHEDRPLSDIVADVWENTDKLVVNHVQLAMVELERRVDLLKADISVFSAGAVFILAAVFSAVAAVILALSTVLAPWLSALLVSIAVAIVGYTLLKRSPQEMKAHITGKKDTGMTEHFRRSSHGDTN